MAKLTPIKAIRAKCIDCSCGELKEVRECPITKCPIWPYRMGKRPKEETETAGKDSMQNTEIANGFSDFRPHTATL